MLELAMRYFDLWNSQNIDGLKEIFSDDVSLHDWEINKTGIEDVLLANTNIFESVPNIRASVKDIALSDNQIMAEVIIHINDNETLDVVDILTVTNGKISSIKAFKK